MDRIEWAEGLRDDTGSNARDRDVGVDERDSVENVREIVDLGLADEARDAKGPGHLGDRDDARDDVGSLRNRCDESSALGLANDQLDQCGRVRVDDARNGLPAPPR